MVEIGGLVVQYEADVPPPSSRTRRARTRLLYEESSLEKIQAMRFRSNMPVTEIFEVADTVVIRPDPVAVAT